MGKNHRCLDSLILQAVERAKIEEEGEQTEGSAGSGRSFSLQARSKQPERTRMHFGSTGLGLLKFMQ